MDLALGRPFQVSAPVDSVTWGTPVVGLIVNSVRPQRALEACTRGAYSGEHVTPACKRGPPPQATS